MTIHLPNDLEGAIRAAVQSGRFADADALVAEAVRHYIDREQQASPQAESPRKRIWEVAAEIRAGVPEEEWAKVPCDGAAQHDHYVYGTPKRPMP